jgi:hypothetical protein
MVVDRASRPRSRPRSCRCRRRCSPCISAGWSIATSSSSRPSAVGWRFDLLTDPRRGPRTGPRHRTGHRTR